MDQHQKITIYSAENTDRSIFRHLREVFRELPEAHELGYRLFKRNIMAMYRQSLLGVVWAIFPPLITAGLWIFLRGNVISVADTAVPYPVFVLVGTCYCRYSWSRYWHHSKPSRATRPCW